jgi:nucleoside-diphosphate-sugar epimerase
VTSGRIVIVGCGFTGEALGRRALASGRSVLATTRRDVRVSELTAAGIDARVVPRLRELASMLEPSDRVAVTFPPDGSSDHELASVLGEVASIVYVSSTAVYGDARGVIDATTPARPDSERGRARVLAERSYLDIGGVALRAPAIYGPGRGLVERLRRGTFRLPGDGAQIVSRIHVDDLASLLLAALESDVRGVALPVADHSAVSQREVVEWLVARLGVAAPPSVPLAEVDETLRHDRRIDGTEAERVFGVRLAFADYRAGFEDCIARAKGA